MPSLKNRTFYVEQTPFAIRIARVAPQGETAVVEEVKTIPPGGTEEVKAIVQEFGHSRNTQMMRAACAVYPARRLLRHASLKQTEKPADPRTLQAIVAGQFKVNPDEYSVAALNADDGTPFNATRQNRHVFFCGAPTQAFRDAQNNLVESGIYPARLELGSVGAVALFLKHLEVKGIDEPFLILEIDAENSHVIVLNKGRIDSARPVSMGLDSMIGGVREELGLKDEAAARRLFFSDSFDFREMGPRLIDRLLRELQSMIGFYEVQTGQSIGRMICSLLPPKLSWLNQTFASALGMKVLDVDVSAVLSQGGLATPAGDGAVVDDLSHGLLGLMLNQRIRK